MNKDQAVTNLAKLMDAAGKANVARGAVYDPNEHMTRDSLGQWEAVARVLIDMIEAHVRGSNLEKTNG